MIALLTNNVKNNYYIVALLKKLHYICKKIKIKNKYIQIKIKQNTQAIMKTQAQILNYLIFNSYDRARRSRKFSK